METFRKTFIGKRIRGEIRKTIQTFPHTYLFVKFNVANEGKAELAYEKCEGKRKRASEKEFIASMIFAVRIVVRAIKRILSLPKLKIQFYLVYVIDGMRPSILKFFLL